MMKKIILATFLMWGSTVIAQKNYRKLSSKDINIERVEFAKKFVEEYFNKCRTFDYTPFSNYIFDKRIEKSINNIEESCAKLKNYFNDKIEVSQVNSVYDYKYLSDVDPVDLIIFDTQFQTPEKHKFVSVWMYHERNIIGGILISEEKPLKSKSKKNL